MNAKYPFRSGTPCRTYAGPVFTSYRKYKDVLAADFQRRCGYTDCSDVWFGGKSGFHIDHFKPKSKHPHLECTYSNLVYACSHVNQAKSDDDSSDYLDPCDEDYNQHFGRDQDGNIVPLPGSPQATYMYQKLKLYLRRYGVIWSLDRLEEKIHELRDLLRRSPDAESKAELMEELDLLIGEYFSYKKYLAATQ